MTTILEKSSIEVSIFTNCFDEFFRTICVWTFWREFWLIFQTYLTSISDEFFVVLLKTVWRIFDELTWHIISCYIFLGFFYDFHVKLTQNFVFCLTMTYLFWRIFSKWFDGNLTSIFDVFIQTDLTGTLHLTSSFTCFFNALFLKANWRIFDEFFGRISCRILAEFWPNFTRLSLRKIWRVILTHFCLVNFNIFGRFFVDHFSRKINFTFFPYENIFRILTDFWNWVTLKFVRPVPHRYIFLFDTLNDDAYETKAGADREQRRPLWFKFKSSAFHNLHKRWRGIFLAKVHH